MRAFLPLFILFSFLLTGCNSDSSTPTGDAPERGDAENGSANSRMPGEGMGTGGSGGNVQVLTGGAGAGGSTPVVGGENLGGGGSGVGDAAKDSARNASTKVSGGGTANQADDDSEGTPDN